MKAKVSKVKPLSNYQLELTFNTNEVKIFDVKPYLNKGIFNELKEPEIFYKVRESFGSILWPNGQDFGPDTLYEESTLSNNEID
jgi:hypothetical protein